MLDLKLVRESPQILKDALNKRNASEDLMQILDKIVALDKDWRSIKKEEEILRAERNKLSLEINELKKQKNETDANEKIKRSGLVSSRIKEISVETKTLEDQIKENLLFIPNIPDQTVHLGKSEADNKEMRKFGKPIKHPADILPHYELGEKSGFIDFERGVKLAQHRFAILNGPLAKLERALVHFMLCVHTQHGYKEVAPPYLVNTKTMTGTGQLPKFKEQLYKADDDLWLIPTAEVPLTNIYAGEILDEVKLPIKLTAFSPCFRKEAGEYGRDIKGLIRQHQFDKVELVKISDPKNSFYELEKMVIDAERILQLLELPYRVIELCTGDMGFASAKTYDIEVWMPSQDKYREISSCSNCTDFQARRADIKYRTSNGLQFVHTLNGSGLAVGRTMIALLENFQEDKKTVVLPKVLQDFMEMETIEFQF